MKERMKLFSMAVVIAGSIVFLIGFYFAMIKAGLPYQDPTQEMSIRWSAYHYAGDVCMHWGSIVFLLGILGRLLIRFKKCGKKPD